MTTPLKVWRESEGRVLRLRLNRPKANLIDAEMIAALDASHSRRHGTTMSSACGRSSPRSSGFISTN